MDSPIMRWRNYNELYRLEASRCVECDTVYFPKKYLCLCNSRTFEPLTLRGIATLISFTHITAAPDRFETQAPYALGIVQFKEGPRITAQITDCNFEDLKIGMTLQATFRKLFTHGKDGVVQYGIKFVPHDQAPEQEQSKMSLSK